MVQLYEECQTIEHLKASGRPLELAVHTWLEPVLNEPEERIPQIRAQGVTAIEAGYPFFVSHPERVVSSNCQFLQEAGIRLWSVHAPFGSSFNLSHPDAPTRREAVEYHKFVLTRVALGQASLMVIHPGNGGQPTSKEEAVPRLLQSLEELVPLADRLGVRLALENLAFDPIGSDPVLLRSIVKQIDSPWLGVCLDTGHAHLAGGVMQTLEVLQDLTITFHLADNDGTRDLHLQPPYGSIPWDDFSALFWDMGFDHPVVIEARPWGDAGYAQQLREVGAVLKGELLTFEGDGRPIRARCSQCGHICLESGDRASCPCT